MAEHRNHFLALTELTPADAVIHVAGREAELFAERKHLIEAACRLSAERCALLRLALYARNAHECAERRQQLLAVRMNI